MVLVILRLFLEVVISTLVRGPYDVRCLPPVFAHGHHVPICLKGLLIVAQVQLVEEGILFHRVMSHLVFLTASALHDVILILVGVAWLIVHVVCVQIDDADFIGWSFQGACCVLLLGLSLPLFVILYRFLFLDPGYI